MKTINKEYIQPLNFLFSLLAIFIYVHASAQQCDCKCDFDRMKQKVAANYAGFRDKVTKNNRDKYQEFTTTLYKEIKNETDFKKCTKLMQAWLAYFDDGHLYLSTDDTSEYKPTFPPSFEKQGNQYCILRIPSFDYHYKKNLDSILLKNRSAIASTPYLIIDLTGNSGGSDNTYEALLPYIYTNTVKVDMIELWASPDNVKQYEDIANDTTRPQLIRKQCKELADKMKLNINSFVAIMDSSVNDKSPDTIFTFPPKVAILLDTANASSAEQFLLEAAQSTRVTTFGTGNTSGTLDYSNLYFEYLPSGKRAVSIPTSRSLRVRRQPFDLYGFAPDVIIPLYTKDKIAFITHYMEK